MHFHADHCAGLDGDHHVGAPGKRSGTGRWQQTAVDHQRGVVCGRAGVETVPRGGDIPGCGEQVLRGWRDWDVCLSVVLLSHSRFQTTRILHHQYLRCYGNCLFPYTDSLPLHFLCCFNNRGYTSFKLSAYLTSISHNILSVSFPTVCDVRTNPVRRMSRSAVCYSSGLQTFSGGLETKRTIASHGVRQHV